MAKLTVHIIRAKDFNTSDFKKVELFLKKLQSLDRHNFKFRFNDSDQIINEKDVEKRAYNFNEYEEAKLLKSDYFKNYFDNHPEKKQEIIAALKKDENYTTWENLFEVCNKYRYENKIKHEEQIVLLTNTNNWCKANKDISDWFGANSENPDNNSFVHTNLWEFYLPGIEKTYPISYMILLLLIIKKSRIGYVKYANTLTHKESIGCISDFTDSKLDVILKLRTGDICDKCLNELLKTINAAHINSYCLMLDEIRSKTLFNRRALGLYGTSKVIVQTINDAEYPFRSVYFEGFKIYLELNARELSVYLYLLNNEEGLPAGREKIEDTSTKVISEIAKFYAGQKMTDIKEAKESVRNWFTITNAGGNNIEVIKNKINKNLKKIIPDQSIRNNYEITLDIKESFYKINIDREELLIWN
jgi:hypothetical protein